MRRVFFIILVLCSLTTAQARDRQNFDTDWRFILADTASMANPDYDDSFWRRLDVPHDWAIEGDFYGAGCQGKVNGTVTSTLTDCEIRGSVFGGGYKATNNDVKVYPTTQPTYSYFHCERGIFSGFGTVEPETWKWRQGSNTSETYDDDKNELYTLSSIKLADLGNVTKAISITIDGDSEVTGNVFGGGNESKSLDNTTVNIQGNTYVHGNVFGGGNKAEVDGSATVNIRAAAPVWVLSPMTASMMYPACEMDEKAMKRFSSD